MAFYILEYADGLRAIGLDNCFTWVDHRIDWRVEGTEGVAKGTIGWPDYPEGSPSTIDWTTRELDGKWEQPRWEERWFPQAFKGTMGQLMRAIQDDVEPEISGRTTLGTMALVEAAYRSFREGRAVPLEETRASRPGIDDDVTRSGSTDGLRSSPARAAVSARGSAPRWPPPARPSPAPIVDADRAEAIARRVADDGGRSLALQVDVTDSAALEAAVQRTIAELGGVDVLVNNAAIYPRRAWTEITEDEWERVLAVNLKAYFLCARACHASMKAARPRAASSTSRPITFLIGFDMLLDYVSSKGGVVGFTRALAHEVGPDGITVNAIAPGAFPTDAEKIHPDPEGYNRWVLDQQCLQRRGTPDDVGNLVVFLASDASSFITGQTVAIDGGWAMH